MPYAASDVLPLLVKRVLQFVKESIGGPGEELVIVVTTAQ